MLENYFFDFCVLRSFIGFAAIVRFQEERGFSANVFNGVHRHIELGIGQVLSLFNSDYSIIYVLNDEVSILV